MKGYAYSVNSEHSNLLAVAGIDTSQDSKDVHSNTCNSCYLTPQQLQAADSSGNIRDGTMSFSVGSPHPDDTTTFTTHASSLHQHASLQEEKDRLFKLIATINQVITYLALNLPNPHDSSSLASQPHSVPQCLLLSVSAHRGRVWRLRTT